MKRVVKHELIEVIIPKNSTQTRFNLPDAQNLRNVQTWGIQTYYSGIIPKSVISNFNLIPKNTFQLSFLTLENYGGREFDKQAPMVQYQTIENNMVCVPLAENVFLDCSIQEKDFKNFVGQKLNFSKCYIDTVGVLSSTTEDLVFLISVYYTDVNENFSQTDFAEKH